MPYTGAIERASTWRNVERSRSRRADTRPTQPLAFVPRPPFAGCHNFHELSGSVRTMVDAGKRRGQSSLTATGRAPQPSLYSMGTAMTSHALSSPEVTRTRCGPISSTSTLPPSGSVNAATACPKSRTPRPVPSHRHQAAAAPANVLQTTLAHITSCLPVEWPCHAPPCGRYCSRNHTHGAKLAVLRLKLGDAGVARIAAFLEM